MTCQISPGIAWHNSVAPGGGLPKSLGNGFGISCNSNGNRNGNTKSGPVSIVAYSKSNKAGQTFRSFGHPT